MATTDQLLETVKPTPEEVSVTEELIRTVVRHDLGLRHLHETDPEFRMAAKNLAGLLPIVMAAMRDQHTPAPIAEAVVFRTAHTALERAREWSQRAAAYAHRIKAPEYLLDPIAEPPC